MEENEHPCEKCKNCMLIGKNEHPDFIHFDISSLASDAIKVSDIKLLSSFFQLTSMNNIIFRQKNFIKNSTQKIYIIFCP